VIHVNPNTKNPKKNIDIVIDIIKLGEIKPIIPKIGQSGPRTTTSK